MNNLADDLVASLDREVRFFYDEKVFHAFEFCAVNRYLAVVFTRN